MATKASYSRPSIYLDDPALRTKIKIAAANRDETLSAYCLGAIRRRLAEDGLLPESESAVGGLADADSRQAAARLLDQLRHEVGTIGVPVHDLITDGRPEGF